MMLSSDTTGSTGDYTATPQTNRSSWQVSPSTGSFDMTYPIRVPPAPAGPVPQVKLTYSSGSLDNFTANRNTQPGWVGQGWGLEPGFIERSYRPCGVTGDLCFAGNVFSISLNGVSSRLVLSDPGQQLYRLEQDPGWLVQKLTYTGGAFQPDPVALEYFRVISPDGVQYFFGRNYHPGAEATNIFSKWALPIYAPSQYMADGTPEPCWGQPYNLCYLTWRWNLDYVIDPNGNAMAYTWHQELNHYNARNLSSTNQWTYVRGGFLEHIDYTSNGAATANARVDFVPASRCQGACIWPQDFPDTPADLDCSPGAPVSCPQTSPSFYTKFRLDRVSTQLRDGAGWRNVESTFFGQDYPQPIDGSPAKLWLRAIQQQENATGTVLPPMQFTGVALSNRRVSGAGVSPMSMYRVNSVRSELGASTLVNYGFLRDCDPSSPPLWWANTTHCFPQWVTDSSGASAWVIFKKHLVTSTTTTDPYGSGPSRSMTYDYGPTIGWHYSDDPVLPENGTSCTCARDNWNDFRGHAEVTVLDSDGLTDFRFYLGMNGDRADNSGGVRTAYISDTRGAQVLDDRRFAGQTYETHRRRVDGVQMNRTVTNYTATSFAGPVAGVQSFQVHPSGQWQQTGPATSTATTETLWAYGKHETRMLAALVDQWFASCEAGDPDLACMREIRLSEAKLGGTFIDRARIVRKTP